MKFGRLPEVDELDLSEICWEVMAYARAGCAPFWHIALDAESRRDKLVAPLRKTDSIIQIFILDQAAFERFHS
jgi:hypothetical protein